MGTLRWQAVDKRPAEAVTVSRLWSIAQKIQA